MIKFIAVGILLNLFFAEAEAASFDVYTYEDGEGYIVMTGDVAPGDVDLLRAAWFHSSVPTYGADLYLNSSGGSVAAGEEVMAFVKDKAMDTVVPQYAECYSMCAEIWLAGDTKVKHTSAVLGFHVAYIGDPVVMMEIIAYEGTVGLQNTIQMAYSLSLDSYVYNHADSLTNPYEFAWNVSNRGYNADLFWVPTDAELNRLVVNYISY